jgi:glycosyltransferase involved in cell wall biosynthesis
VNISFIIPAHNEAHWVADCIRSIQQSLRDGTGASEIIVVDDASEDHTALVAQRSGARVLRIDARHISAARNAGAREATGGHLFFVDADTVVSREALGEAIAALETGAVGGGAVPRFDSPLPRWARVLYPAFALVTRALRQPGGSCLFCTRDAFRAAGGFSEAHYVAEDAHFAARLKRLGRFVVLREKVRTSGRNLRAHSFGRFASLLVRLALRGPDGFRHRGGLDIWYAPNRTERRGKPPE